MSRALLGLVLLGTSACLDFERRVNDCFDGGRCVVMGDGGLDGGGGGDGGGGRADGGFEPLLTPGLCADGWCWEAPLPHGTRLNAVFGDGDDVLVAGDNGLVAERRAGRWRSWQSEMPSDIAWRGLWGRSRDDVYLAGAARAWHFTDGGWTSRATTATALTAVTGTPAEVFFGDEMGRVYRLASNALELVSATGAGEVVSMRSAYGSLFALTRSSYPATTLLKLDGGRLDFDAGALDSVFGWDNGLWLAGEQAISYSVSAALVATSLDAGLTAGSAGPMGAVRAAAGSTLGTLTGDVFTTESSGQWPVRAIHEGPSTTWAVGAAGLVQQRRDGGWLDLVERPTFGEVRAVVPFEETLVAVTSTGELLVRGPFGWRTRWSSLQAVFVDVAVDGADVYVLAEDQRVFTVRRTGTTWAQSGNPVRFGQPMNVAAHRLWLTAAGTLVATSDEGLFFRRRGAASFTAVADTAQVWGLAGKGEVVRACGATRFVEVDLSQATPVVGSSGAALSCRAVLALADGWALGGREVGGVPFVVRTADGATFVFRTEQAFVEDLELVPGGIAVAVNGIGLVPLGVPGSDLTPLPTRISQTLHGLATWRGRLFAVGDESAIVHGDLP